MRFRFAIFLVLVACDSAEPSQPAVAPMVTESDDGLLFTWFDENGPHIAESRDEIPEAALTRVKVEALDTPPDDRNPDHVWIADLRSAAEGGRFPVEGMSRSALDALLDASQGVDFEAAAAARAAADDVVLYGASWCGACRAAANFFRQNDIPFVEHDIEENPAARSEMQSKARAAGVQTSGIPVIDVHGTLVTGFDERRIRSLLDG